MKPAVLAEICRVLTPGGRIGIADIVAEDHLTPADCGSYAGCIAGALSKTEYEQGLAAADFENISVTFTHQAADGLRSAIIKATKPTTAGVGTDAGSADRSLQLEERRAALITIAGSATWGE